MDDSPPSSLDPEATEEDISVEEAEREDARRTEEFHDLASSLEEAHDLFTSLHQVGAPFFTESVPTAAIVFTGRGTPLRFLFNPAYWDKLPRYDRRFVLCHEMLHVALHHGFRSQTLEENERANVAADLVVNQLLVSQFGFERSLLVDGESYCWLDTIFPEPGTRPRPGLTMEAYYRLLPEGFGAASRMVDEHFFSKTEWGGLDHRRAAAELESLLSGAGPDLLEDFAKRIGGEGEAAKRPGGSPGGFWAEVAAVPPPPVPWDKLLKRRIKARVEEKPSETWRLPSRRMASFPEASLPGIAESDASGASRQRVVFFLDASGSAWGDRAAFLALARSLALGPYDIHLCSFDTEVYPLDLKKPRLAGLGGTSFGALESYIQSTVIRVQKKPYPDLVVVLTDGYGSPVEPEKPERWHWILTTPCRTYVPKGSQVILTRDHPLMKV